MQYVATHPRKVRGGQVHQPKNEKIKKQREDLNNNGFEIKVRGVSNRACDADSERKTVEAAYLVPDVDNFIEFPEVKRLEKRITLWLDSGYPVHVIGPTGCGKTSLAMHVAKKIGHPVVWINGDESVTTTDLIGGYSQVETESVRDKYVHNVFKSKDILKADWVDNPLTLACKYGYTLIYNEFSRTKPASNNVFLSVFEEGILELPTKFGVERYVKVHPEFKAILTSNPLEYAGVYRPQDALLDRMVGIYMDYYSFDMETRIVEKQSGTSEENAKRIVSIVRSLREKLPEDKKPGTRASIMIAKGLNTLNGHGDISLEDLCLDVIGTKTESSKELAEIQKLLEETIVETS